MNQVDAFFVTRAKRGMKARRVYSIPTDRTIGIICDWRIALNGYYSAKMYPRTVKAYPQTVGPDYLKDPQTRKTLIFLTTNTTLKALTIATLYKDHW